jgi:hypothetical protein
MSDEPFCRESSRNRGYLDGGPALQVFASRVEIVGARSCVLARPGTMLPIVWDLSCPAVCIALTVLITCALSLVPAIDGLTDDTLAQVSLALSANINRQSMLTIVELSAQPGPLPFDC